MYSLISSQSTARAGSFYCLKSIACHVIADHPFNLFHPTQKNLALHLYIIE